MSLLSAFFASALLNAAKEVTVMATILRETKRERRGTRGKERKGEGRATWGKGSYKHVWRGEVVEQSRRVSVVGGRDGDVDDAPRAVERLLHKQVTRNDMLQASSNTQ